MLGNSGAGKSTLTKALSEEGGIFGRFRKVKSVIPLTPGIDPLSFHSKVFGRVNLYDFAGHEEYYASHEMILCQSSHPIVLLAIKMTLSMEDIQRQLQYWLFILNNSTAINNVESMHAVVIGSYSDLVKVEDKELICQKVSSIMNAPSSIKYRGFVPLDCRYSISTQLTKLRQELSVLCKEVRENTAYDESDYSNRLCATLMYYIRQNINTSEHITISVSRLCKQIKEIPWLQTKFPGPTLAKLTGMELLLETCATLSSSGHFLLLRDQSPKKSLLVLNERVILARVHASLSTIKKSMTNDRGLLEEYQLHEILAPLSCYMKPELATKYLIITQFCTRITSDQLVTGSELTQRVHYFFPNLVNASRPNDLLSAEDKSYSLWYTWYLRCALNGEFFTPRFPHTLFIQLIKCESEISGYAQYNVWKNGIIIVHSNGTRFVIEITNQTTQLQLVMQCITGCGAELVQQRSMLIGLIKSLTKKVCPKVKLIGYLLPCQSAYPLDAASGLEIRVADAAKPVVRGHKFVVIQTEDMPRHINIPDLLLFDSFHKIAESVIVEIFSNKDSNRTIPDSVLGEVCEAVSEIDILSRSLRDQARQSQLTYSHLYKELHKYTVFSDGSLCVSH